MSRTDAATLADLLDAWFEFVADLYVDATDAGGGLEDVIAQLRAEAAS